MSLGHFSTENGQKKHFYLDTLDQSWALKYIYIYIKIQEIVQPPLEHKKDDILPFFLVHTLKVTGKKNSMVTNILQNNNNNNNSK